MKTKAKTAALCGLLVCTALILSLVEGFIPAAAIPIPGIKLGLANIVILFALYKLGFRCAVMILLARSILASLFGGGITSLLFSLSGGVLSLLTMYLLKKIPPTRVSIYGVSIAGAAMHGVGQIIASVFMLKTVTVVFYLPVLLISGIITGTLIGAVTGMLFKKTPPKV